jgi:hypothetical protein
MPDGIQLNPLKMTNAVLFSENLLMGTAFFVLPFTF